MNYFQAKLELWEDETIACVHDECTWMLPISEQVLDNQPCQCRKEINSQMDWETPKRIAPFPTLYHCDDSQEFSTKNENYTELYAGQD